ncbi:TPA: hypothetical protein IF648_004522 [Escherichia coli]|nr:hypothetical protein [Escherichia coli]
MTEKQIEKLFVGAKKFFKNSALVITHIEVMEIGDKKCVAVVASRVERDSLDTITKYKDHRVFWFGCRFQMDKLTREPKITCSTNAGVNPYVSVLTETMTQNANGTSYRGGVFKRLETGKTLEGSRELTEARKETNRKSYEAMKARKAAAKAEKEEARKAQEKADAEKQEKEKGFAPIRENAKHIDSQLDSFEMPEESGKDTKKDYTDSEVTFSGKVKDISYNILRPNTPFVGKSEYENAGGFITFDPIRKRAA